MTQTRVNLTKEEEQALRFKDFKLLEFIIEHGDPNREDVTAAVDMLAKLKAERRVYDTLSRSQRGMIMAICRRIEPSGEGWRDEDGIDPAERNKNVPKGNPVETPAVLKNLPLKPPKRKVVED